MVAPVYGVTQTDVAFVFYDAGETLALEPVIKLLESRNIKAKALIMGTARSLLKDCHHCLDIQKDCGTHETVDQNVWDSAKQMGAGDLDRVWECVKPRLVVVGTASEVQWQIAQKFKDHGVDSIAYDDALSIVEANPLSAKFLALKTFWVPSRLIREQVKKLSPKSNVIAVGQPTLENWRVASLNENPKSIVDQVPGYRAGKITVLYAGGYGEGYRDAFLLFLQAASERPDYQYMISPHPKMDGSLEKELLQLYPNIHAVFVPKSVGTMKAAIISQVVVSRDSTVGVQAVFMNRPTIYLDVPGTSYSNIAIQNRWARQAFSKIQFNEFVHNALSSAPKNHPDIFNLAGIPMNGAMTMAEALIEELKSRSKPRP